jgi:hypothetical protein
MSAPELKQKATARSTRKPPSKGIVLEVRVGDDPDQKEAEAVVGPYLTNAIAYGMSMKGTLGELDLSRLMKAMMESAKRIRDNDFSDVEAMLMSQAAVLNGMFADLAQRAALNRSAGHFEASQAYLKMAFKAQNQARMALETLSTVKNPPVVYAKQANIAHGPQQVNNGPASATRTGERKNAQTKLLGDSNEQPLDLGASGVAGSGHSSLEAVGAVNGAED